MTFDQGVERIRAAISKSGVNVGKGIISSRDPEVRKVLTALEVTNVPDGFSKVQLPFYFDKPTQLYVTTAKAGAEVPKHSHTEGDAFRYVADGEIEVLDVVYKKGDWMIIPKDHEYWMKVLKDATMMYCYSCCCA